MCSQKRITVYHQNYETTGTNRPPRIKVREQIKSSRNEKEIEAIESDINKGNRKRTELGI